LVGLREGRGRVEGEVGASEDGARVFLIGSSPSEGAAEGEPVGLSEDGEEEGEEEGAEVGEEVGPAEGEEEGSEEGATLGSAVGEEEEEDEDGFGEEEEEGEREARAEDGEGEGDEDDALPPEQIAALTSSMGQMAMLRTKPAEAGTLASPTCTSTAVTTLRAKGKSVEAVFVTTPSPARRERLNAGLGSRDVTERVSRWPHETTLTEDHERRGRGSGMLTEAEILLRPFVPGSDCEYDAITRKVLLMNWIEGTELRKSEVDFRLMILVGNVEETKLVGKTSRVI